MKVHSCGAILYTIHNGKTYFILGKEHNQWTPFKGRVEPGESYEKAAIRELYEETGGLVKIDSIALNCCYSTIRKIYHIGLVYVPFDFAQQFARMLRASNDPHLEKTDVKYFDITDLDSYDFHQISWIPIRFYINVLRSINMSLPGDNIPKQRVISRMNNAKKNTKSRPNRLKIRTFSKTFIADLLVAAKT
jgi:8-oxo-dGTP pyrophosphatase MutT (NUDIX family)